MINNMWRRIVVVLIILVPIALYCAYSDSERGVDYRSETPRVLVLTPEYYTYGGGTAVEQLIVAAGGQNVARDRPAYSQLSDRELLALNPDIILFTETWTHQQLLDWQTFTASTGLTAVQNNRLYQLGFSLADSTITANRADYIQQLQQLFMLV